MKTTFSKLVEESKGSLETIDSQTLKDMIDSKEDKDAIGNISDRGVSLTSKKERKVKEHFALGVQLIDQNYSKKKKVEPNYNRKKRKLRWQVILRGANLIRA